MKIAIIGSFGNGNTGDEAAYLALQLMINSLCPGTQYVLLTRKEHSYAGPMICLADLNKEKFSRLDADIDYYFYTGGGIIEPGTSSLCYQSRIIWENTAKPLILFGINAGKSENYTPTDKQIVTDFCNKSSYISTRTNDCKDVLLELGIGQPVEVTPDVVFGLELLNLMRARSGKIAKIGISLNSRWYHEPAFCDKLSTLITMLIDKYHCEIVFVPFCIHSDDDRLLANKLVGQIPLKYHMRIQNVQKYKDPLEVLQMMNELDLMICMRLHAVIYSLVLGLPFMAIPNSPKIYSALEDNEAGQYAYPEARKDFTYRNYAYNYEDAFFKLEPFLNKLEEVSKGYTPRPNAPLLLQKLREILCIADGTLYPPAGPDMSGFHTRLAEEYPVAHYYWEIRDLENATFYYKALLTQDRELDLIYRRLSLIAEFKKNLAEAESWLQKISRERLRKIELIKFYLRSGQPARVKDMLKQIKLQENYYNFSLLLATVEKDEHAVDVYVRKCEKDRIINDAVYKYRADKRALFDHPEAYFNQLVSPDKEYFPYEKPMY